MQLLRKSRFLVRQLDKLKDKLALNRFLLYLSLMFFVLIIDRISKNFALSLLEPFEIVKNFIYLQVSYNNGLSWGLFSTDNIVSEGLWSSFNIINILIICVIVGLVKYVYDQIVSGKTVYAELLILSGALANLFDRFYYKAVIDFIVIDFGFWVFPIFNLADAAIVLGGTYILTTLIFSNSK